MGKNTTPSNQTSDAVVTNYAASIEWVLAMLSPARPHPIAGQLTLRDIAYSSSCTR